MIVYQCPDDRVVGPCVHGSYVMKTSRLRLPLVSFLCEAIRHPGGGCDRTPRPRSGPPWPSRKRPCPRPAWPERARSAHLPL